MKHILIVAVAVLFVALSLAHGGYSHELIAASTVGIWWAIVIALAVRFWPRASTPLGALVAGGLLACFAAWTALSIGWASDNGAAFVEAVRVLGYLGLFVLVVIASPRGGARAWLTGLALGLAAVSVLALLSRFEPSFGGNGEIGKFLPSARGRLSYPIGYWNGLAACMALAAVLLGWLGAQARTLPGRVLAVAALPLPILVVYLASSRGGVAAGAAGLAVLLALGPARARALAGLVIGGAGGAVLVLIASHKDALVNGLGGSVAADQGDQMLVITIAVVVVCGVLRLLVDRPVARLSVPRPVTVVVMSAAAVAIVIGVIAADPSRRWDDFKSPPGPISGKSFLSSHLTSDYGSGRYQFWSTAVDAFQSEPLHGIGAGAYEAYWDQHGSLSKPVRDAHSLYFESLGELGVVGAALLLAFLGVSAAMGLARGPARWSGGEVGAALGVMAAGLVSAAVDWTWELPACFGPVVLAAALLTGPALGRAPAGSPAARDGASGRFRLGLGIATIAAGLVAIWAAGVLFLSLAKIGDSQDAVDRGDLPAAAQGARDASTLEPWAAEPHLQLALVDELGGDLGSANHEIDKAIDHAPDNWQLWFVKARLGVKSGDVAAGRRALARARALNPRAPFLAD